MLPSRSLDCSSMKHSLCVDCIADMHTLSKVQHFVPPGTDVGADNLSSSKRH